MTAALSSFWDAEHAAFIDSVLAAEARDVDALSLLGDCFPVVHPPAVEPDEEAA
jgi:hypothetical protein